MRASTAFFATFCPTWTRTAVTCPDTAKSSASSAVGSTVPEADTLSRIVPVVTATTRCVVAADADDERDAAQAPDAAAATTTMTIGTTILGRRIIARTLNRNDASCSTREGKINPPARG